MWYVSIHIETGTGYRSTGELWVPVYRGGGGVKTHFLVIVVIIVNLNNIIFVLFAQIEA